MNVKRILIPSELDELSAKVTDFAVELAEQLNVSEIVLLNVIIPAHIQAFSTSGEDFAADSDMAIRFNEVLKEKHQKLAKVEAEKFTTDKVKIKPIARFMDSKTDLNKYMEEYRADLIVCGSRNKQDFLNLLFGPDTGKMLRKVDYPMIILKDGADAGEIQNILAAIDINEEGQNGLREIAGLAKALNANIQLLHVFSGDTDSSDQAIMKLRDLAVKNKFSNYDINLVNDDSLEDGIHHFVRLHKTDMIAVSSQGKGKIHRLIFGSNNKGTISSTEDIIKETEKPVFVSKIC